MQPAATLSSLIKRKIISPIKILVSHRSDENALQRACHTPNISAKVMIEPRFSHYHILLDKITRCLLLGFLILLFLFDISFLVSIRSPVTDVSQCEAFSFRRIILKSICQLKYWRRWAGSTTRQLWFMPVTQLYQYGTMIHVSNKRVYVS